MDWSLGLGLVVMASFVALACLLAVSALPDRTAQAPRSIFGERTPSTVLLFDADRLVDATPSARAMLAGEAAPDPGESLWLRALSRLEPIFPGLALRIEGLQREGRFILCSRADVAPPLVLRAEYLGGMTRLTLLDGEGEAQLPTIDGAAETALQEELGNLRDTLFHAPLLIWRETAEGEVIWANGAYLRTAQALAEGGPQLSWPLPALFPRDGAASGNRRVLRVEGETRWYELSTIGLKGESLHYAQAADRLIAAEKGQHEFMQTLAKTFAHLPIGLAIFDRHRVLQMFNPALIELTGMPGEFLISRPTLSSLLDAMREKAMLPEPKDYRNWRRQILDLEAAAASGLFQDTWTLPSGQTTRVTGRPHPNGGLAFMFEDISTEMTRTRRYRADLELGQAVIDAMEDAVVVFTQDGALGLSNKAALDLWPGLDQALLSVAGGPSVLGIWRDRSAPSLIWSDLADSIGSFGPRDPWEGEVRLKDGRLLRCRVTPLPQGSTLVAFRLVEAKGPQVAEEGPAVMIA